MTRKHRKKKSRFFSLLAATTVLSGLLFSSTACGIIDPFYQADSSTNIDTAGREWMFRAFGANVNSSHNGCEGGFGKGGGAVTIYSEDGAGKIVPGSTDGLAFYYTCVDPEHENFTLSATVTVDSWTYSNGQEGFGMMVSDAVGENYDKTPFWNNAYQLIVSKMEYFYDNTKDEVTSGPSADEICMKLGVGTLSSPVTITAKEIERIQSGEISVPEGWGTGRVCFPLETSCGQLGTGTYNIVGNCTNQERVAGNQSELLTAFRMQIRRTNTGYCLTYLNEDGEEIGSKLFYDPEGNALCQIDPDHIYVGFFASRNARITVTDMELTIIDPDDDEAPVEREIDILVPSCAFVSAGYSNTSDYELTYFGNADGILTITDAAGEEIAATYARADTRVSQNVTLVPGPNTFTGSFIPDPDYMPSEYTRLASYDPRKFKLTVTYEAYDSDYLYIAPEGVPAASGARNDPMDLYTAVKIINPGQTIVILDGTYHLTDSVVVERGIDGTKNNPIYMIADPEGTGRPVFDFGGRCAGMILAGDYWYFSGFAVTGSSNGEDGILLSGNYNTVDDVWLYRNGNTGLEIARYKETDDRDLWPSGNLVLNCTSFLNADGGYEDADGFAAKITAGDGNVFDGCIAAYNADDGFDLYAKVQYGPIGTVTIKNSVAFKNGYDMINGEEVAAGDGNGFKLGGENMPNAHQLINCIAFANRSYGIDSNKNTDIQIYFSTAFDNGSANIALYAGTELDTAYVADGILSYRSEYGKEDHIDPAGSQDMTDIEAESNYYYNYYDSKKESKNSAGETVTDDWFVDLDTDAAIHGGIGRDNGNRIDMGGYLELTPLAPDGTGAVMT